MNPHGAGQLAGEPGSECLRGKRVRQKPVTPCVEGKKQTNNHGGNNIMASKRGRVIGLDVHPDSFAGAIMEGSDPARARVVSTSTRVELEQLEQWAERHARSEDVLGFGSQRERVCGRATTAGRGLPGGNPRQS